MSYIKLIEVEDGFKIENDDKNVSFDVSLGELKVVLKSSVRPEWSSEYPYYLFLQGSDAEYNDDVVNIQRPYLKHILYAIIQYNIVSGNDTLNRDLLKYKFQCKHCNKIKPVTQFSEKHFDYCVDCIDEIRLCEDCKRLGAEYKFGDEYFCNHCVSHNHFCHSCETPNKTVKIFHVTLPEDYHGEGKSFYICSDCWGKPLELGREHHYHYVPDQFNFWDYDYRKKKRHKTDTPINNKLYMGMEIEAMFNNKRHTNIVLGKILKLYGENRESLLYAKHDGTVPDPGSEIVTHPMTLNMFRSLTWKGLFEHVVKPTTTGIGGHIHMNKTAFASPIHIYKFCHFLRTNISYAEWVGQRHLEDEWCKGRSLNGKVVSIAKQYNNVKNRDRYEMINFTQNTVELRFFWSPSNTSMLLKNVEFVDSLFNFTRDCRMHFTYSEFEEYINKYCIKYPYFYNFMLDRDDCITFKPNNEYYITNGCTVNEPDEGEDIQIGCCYYCSEPIYSGDSVNYDGSHLLHPDCYDDYMEGIEEEEI